MLKLAGLNAHTLWFSRLQLRRTIIGALAVAWQQNAKTFELRAAAGLARLWRDQGKRAEAHDLLAPVHGWFTEGFDTPVLQEARILLAELAS